MKVWWLIISFVWGTLNLWTHPSKTLLSLIDTPISEEVKNWTFGQVIAIMLLLAPIIALGEGYMAESKSNPQESQFLVRYALIT